MIRSLRAYVCMRVCVWPKVQCGPPTVLLGSGMDAARIQIVACWMEDFWLELATSYSGWTINE